jgi:thioredoxin 1
MSGTLTVAKVDIDKNKNLAVQHGIGSVPTLMVFVDKKQAAMRVGALSKSELIDWVTQASGTPAS